MLRVEKDYQIISLNYANTQSNTRMAKVQIKECESKEVFNCIIWEEYLVKMDKRALKVGNIISIMGHDFNEKFNNYVIKQIQVIKEASIGLSEEEREALFAKILNLVQGFKDEKLKAEILELINQNKELLKISPAAKKHHHNYVGGLIKHILECIDYAKALFPVVNTEIDHEVILAACIIHDFGKMFEYTVDLETGAIEVNESWQDIWINHIHWDAAGQIQMVSQ